MTLVETILKNYQVFQEVKVFTLINKDTRPYTLTEVRFIGRKMDSQCTLIDPNVCAENEAVVQFGVKMQAFEKFYETQNEVIVLLLKSSVPKVSLS